MSIQIAKGGAMNGFSPGDNMAMKVPADQFDATVQFYRDVIGLRQIKKHLPSFVFDFNGKNLWIDKMDNLPRAEIWLEIRVDDVKTAAGYLKSHKVQRRDEVEKLPEGFDGFWISNPAGIIHLVCND
ncbi:MAG: VOC family protein [Calditrichaceae bacterium]